MRAAACPLFFIITPKGKEIRIKKIEPNGRENFRYNSILYTLSENFEGGLFSLFFIDWTFL